MTAVQPINNSNEKIHAGPGEQLFIAGTANRDDIEMNQDLISMNSENGESLMKSLSPLLKSMRLFGLYFHWFRKTTSSATEGEHRVDIAPTTTAKGKCSSLSAKLVAIYAIGLLVYLWLNAVRLLTMFTSSDTMMAVILSKVFLTTWHFQCAMQQTAYFVACRSGKLDRVLENIRLNSPMCSTFSRHLAVKLTAVAWLVAAVNFSFYAYSLLFTGGLADMLITPVKSYIHVANLTPYRVSFAIASLPMHVAWCFPAALTLMISTIFAFQFHNLAVRMRQVIEHSKESGKEIQPEDIEAIRQQHQILCRNVERADSFLRIHHFAGFFGPLVIIISVLYIIIFGQSVEVIVVIIWSVGGSYSGHYLVSRCSIIVRS